MNEYLITTYWIDNRVTTELVKWNCDGREYILQGEITSGYHFSRAVKIQK